MTPTHSLSSIAQAVNRLGQSWRWLGLFAAISTCFYCTGAAKAAERATLQYADRQITVSLTELEDFAQHLPIRFAPSGDRELSRNAQALCLRPA